MSRNLTSVAVIVSCDRRARDVVRGVCVGVASGGCSRLPLATNRRGGVCPPPHQLCPAHCAPQGTTPLTRRHIGWGVCSCAGVGSLRIQRSCTCLMVRLSVCGMGVGARSAGVGAASAGGEGAVQEIQAHPAGGIAAFHLSIYFLSSSHPRAMFVSFRCSSFTPSAGGRFPHLPGRRCGLPMTLFLPP